MEEIFTGFIFIKMFHSFLPQHFPSFLPYFFPFFLFLFLPSFLFFLVFFLSFIPPSFCPSIQWNNNVFSIDLSRFVPEDSEMDPGADSTTNCVQSDGRCSSCWTLKFKLNIFWFYASYQLLLCVSRWIISVWVSGALTESGPWSWRGSQPSLWK